MLIDDKKYINNRTQQLRSKLTGFKNSGNVFVSMTKFIEASETLNMTRQDALVARKYLSEYSKFVKPDQEKINAYVKNMVNNSKLENVKKLANSQLPDRKNIINKIGYLTTFVSNNGLKEKMYSRSFVMEIVDIKDYFKYALIAFAIYYLYQYVTELVAAGETGEVKSAQERYSEEMAEKVYEPLKKAYGEGFLKDKTYLKQLSAMFLDAILIILLVYVLGALLEYDPEPMDNSSTVIKNGIYVAVLTTCIGLLFMQFKKFLTYLVGWLKREKDRWAGYRIDPETGEQVKIKSGIVDKMFNALRVIIMTAVIFYKIFKIFANTFEEEVLNQDVGGYSVE